MWARSIVMRIRILRNICLEGLVAVRTQGTWRLGILAVRLGTERFDKHRVCFSY